MASHSSVNSLYRSLHWHDAKQFQLVCSAEVIVDVLPLILSSLMIVFQSTERATHVRLKHPGLQNVHRQLVRTYTAIQRPPKVLTFPPIGAKFASKILGISAEAHKVMMNTVNDTEGDSGLSVKLYTRIRSAGLSGLDFDTMNRDMI